jgi:hypothetical protein
MCALLFAGAFLSACSGTGSSIVEPGAWDPHGAVHGIAEVGRPVIPSVEMDTVLVTWRRVTPEDLARIEPLVSPFMRIGLHGMGLLDIDARTCTVYAVAPTVDMSPEMAIFGHELLHCFFGSFHDAQPYPSSAEIQAMIGRIERVLARSVETSLEGAGAPRPFLM